MNRKALIVANGQFDDPEIPPLKSPVPDGERLKALLEDPDVGGYEVQLVADADHLSYKLAVNAFFEQADPDDLLVLLITGHGMRDRAGRLHFVARDTRHDALLATAVESLWVHGRAQDSIAGRQVILVDTCHSGAFLKGGAFKSAVAQAVDKADFFTAADEADVRESGKGRVLITASCERQLAQEHESGTDGVAESVFTRTLIQGIANGDADPDGTGEITVDNLYKHVRRALAREKVKQTPQYYPLGAVEGSLVVAHNPAARVELPDEIKTKLAAPLPRDRAEAVDMLLALARGREVVLKRKAFDALRELVADDSTQVATQATLALTRLGGAARTERDPEVERLRAEKLRLETELADARKRAEEARRAEERGAQDQAEAEERARKAELDQLQIDMLERERRNRDDDARRRRKEEEAHAKAEAEARAAARAAAEEEAKRLKELERLQLDLLERERRARDEEERQRRVREQLEKDGQSRKRPEPEPKTGSKLLWWIVSGVTIAWLMVQCAAGL